MLLRLMRHFLNSRKAAYIPVNPTTGLPRMKALVASTAAPMTGTTSPVRY